MRAALPADWGTGEGDALRWLARQEVAQGAAITHVYEREILPERSGSHIRIFRADCSNYHQAGYDIVRTEEAADRTVAAQTYYEVKSTTCTEQMCRFQLSPVQVQTAIRAGEAYRILRPCLGKNNMKLWDMVWYRQMRPAPSPAL